MGQTELVSDGTVVGLVESSSSSSSDLFDVLTSIEPALLAVDPFVVAALRPDDGDMNREWQAGVFSAERPALKAMSRRGFCGNA